MDPLPDSSPDSTIAAAWENNMLALFRLFGTSPLVEYTETPLFARWHTRLPHPYFEGVQVFQPPPDDARLFIQEQVFHFRSRGEKMFAWWLHPSANRAAWEDPLTELGFTFEPGGPYMALKLAELPEAVHWPEGLEIHAVQDRQELRAWIETFARGYEFRPEFKEPFTRVYRPLGVDLPLRHYLASLRGQPVAAATLFLAEGVAGIWNVATLKEARGQGIGSAITWQPLRDAREMGYAIAALDATEMGYPVYSKLGFREIPCSGNFIKTL